MEKISEKDKALNRLSALCSRSEQCTSSLQEKLEKWGLEPPVIREILDYLTAEKYFDDQRYARAFVRDKTRLQGWGRQKIKMALGQKKIEAAIIEVALREEIDPEEQQKRLRSAIEIKNRSLHCKNDLERRSKLFRFGLSRGFSYEEIYKALQGIEEYNY